MQGITERQISLVQHLVIVAITITICRGTVRMALCEDCQKFDVQSFTRDPHAQRGYSYKDVCERANICAFCNLLCNSFDPGLPATWVHFEPLTSKRERIRHDQRSLEIAFLRVFLGERLYLKWNPNFPSISKDFPRGQDALLYVCADEG